MKHTVAQSSTSFCKKSDPICFLKVQMLVLIQFHVNSKKFGLKSYEPAKKPQLISQMKKKRLEFAKKHIEWRLKTERKCFYQMNPAFNNSQQEKNHVC